MTNEKELIDALNLLEIYDEEFYKYIKQHTKIIKDTDNIKELCGCFIIKDNNMIKGIRVLVPEIVNIETLLINIHEYTHAYEYYYKIGNLYFEDIENSEKIATSNEIKYLQLTKNKSL